MLSVGDNIVSQIMLAQENGVPKRIYRKAIVGRVIVRSIDPFSGGRTEVLIEGDPQVTEAADLEVSLWTSLEVKYFEKANKGLIENGSLIRVEERSVETINYDNAISDAQIAELVVAPYFTLKSEINKLSSETTLQRILKIAEDLNRPAKSMRLLMLRLEEIQQES